jgi:hypothetical protein
MEHRLVTAIQKALGWDAPALLGADFARGELADPGLPERLMTPTRLLDLVMHRHLSNPQLRMYAQGEELHPSLYLAETMNRRRQAVRQADMARVGAILNGGGTLVLDSVDVFDRTIQTACRALGWWSGELVSANMYLAVGDTAGFHLHWDDHDVICVQLAGRKSWEVRGASRPHPMYRDAERNTEPATDVIWTGTMEPGDVMHIPRGYWHTATRVGSGEGCSLHVTFGITRRTGVTWINHLSDVARTENVFRTDLEGASAADRKLLITQLANLAIGHDPARYLADLRATTPAPRHLPYVSAFGPLTGIVAVTEFEPVITTKDATVEVVAAGKRLTFAARTEHAVRTMLSGHPVGLAEADEVTMRLAEHLIKEGLCEPLTAESSSGYTGLVPPASCSKPPCPSV